MSGRRNVGAAALGAASAAILAGLLELVGRAARSYEGAPSLADAIAGPVGIWHAIAVEAPLRTVPSLVASLLALRLLAATRADAGALVGSASALAAAVVQGHLRVTAHPFFSSVIAATFGAAIGAAAAERQPRPRASSTLVFAWLMQTASMAAELTVPTPRGRAAIFLAASLTVVLAATHIFLERRQRRLRDDVGATISLASRTIQSLTPWHLRRHGAAELSLRWLTFGILTTLGLLVTACVAAVAAGRALGLDFATFEHEAGAASSDLAFVGAFVLAAFAVSGWLLSRAAGPRAPTEAVLGPLVVVPLAIAALPTGQVGFVVTLALGLTAVLLIAAGVVTARRINP